MSTDHGHDSASNELPPNAIAVIGMAGRFPGADSLSQFWENLSRAEESVTTLSEEALTAAGVSAKTLEDPAYVRRAAMLNGIEEFDAEYFGITPYTARMMDPQQRLFLQTAWHAIEDSGYDPARYDGAIGVFASSSASGYLMDNMMSHRDTKTMVGEGATVEMFELSCSERQGLPGDAGGARARTCAGRRCRCRPHVRHRWSPCTSPARVCCPVNATWRWPVASSIRVPHQVGYWYEPGAMVSPPGTAGRSTSSPTAPIFGSGVAAVVLKPLQAALDDGDRIHAVIRGFGDQQRRLDEDDLRRTRRRRAGRGHRRGARRRRGRRLDHRLSSRRTAPAPRSVTPSKSKRCDRLSSSPSSTGRPVRARAR